MSNDVFILQCLLHSVRPLISQTPVTSVAMAITDFDIKCLLLTTVSSPASLL